MFPNIHIPARQQYLPQLSILMACLIAFLSGTAVAQQHTQRENKLKAAYLLNFLQFIEWPEEQESVHEEFILGILGKDQFGAIVDELFKNETIDERDIVVKRFRTIADLTHCDALFISGSEKDNLKEIFQTLEDAPVLTVSDIPGFEDLGGGIGFFLDENKLRFAINIRVMDVAGLKVSSKLLRLAKIVDPL